MPSWMRGPTSDCQLPTATTPSEVSRHIFKLARHTHSLRCSQRCTFPKSLRFSKPTFPVRPMSTGLSYRSTNRVHIPLDCEPEDGDLGGLHPGEVFWRDHQIWLFEKGYMLRPRYRPGWVPSWLPGSGSPYFRYEDGLFSMVRKFTSYPYITYQVFRLLRMRGSWMPLVFPIIHW